MIHNRHHDAFPPRGRELLVGVGSAHGDDAVGWLVADGLIVRGPWPEQTICKVSSPLDILDWVDHAQSLIICDACQGAGKPGGIHHWQWPSDELLGAQWSGSHDFPLPAALQLAERLSKLPRQVVLWGIEKSPDSDMEQPTASVAMSVEQLVESIANEWSSEASRNA